MMKPSSAISGRGEVTRLNVLYSIDQEVEYVKYVVHRLPWYIEQGYFIENIRIPQGITKDSNDEEIIKAMNREYSDADYIECAEKLRQGWASVAAGFRNIQTEPSFHLAKGYTVVLTKYGIGGSYDVDANQVIVRVNTQPSSIIAGIVTHEIIHMTIQYLIDRHRIRHWRKERFVDLLMEHYFPGLKKMQIIKEDVSIVDSVFKKLFPNLEAIAQLIGDEK